MVLKKAWTHNDLSAIETIITKIFFHTLLGGYYYILHGQNNKHFFFIWNLQALQQFMFLSLKMSPLFYILSILINNYSLMFYKGYIARTDLLWNQNIVNIMNEINEI